MYIYAEVREQAQAMADKSGRDYGIERYPTGEYAIHALPNPEHRAGFELRCEVVHPSGTCAGCGGFAPTVGPHPMVCDRCWPNIVAALGCDPTKPR